MQKFYEIRVATGAASRLRLKPSAAQNATTISVTSGNRGGFSFEIETSPDAARSRTAACVATGAASRLRLKPGKRYRLEQRCHRGNRGGFSFEIETLPGKRGAIGSGQVATGAASRLRLKLFKRTDRGQGPRNVATGAASRLRLKLSNSFIRRVLFAKWQPGRLLV